MAEKLDSAPWPLDKLRPEFSATDRPAPRSTGTLTVVERRPKAHQSVHLPPFWQNSQRRASASASTITSDIKLRWRSASAAIQYGPHVRASQLLKYQSCTIFPLGLESANLPG
jgi:hypothetical protein